MEDKIFDGGELPGVNILTVKPFSFDFELGKRVLFPKGYSTNATAYIAEIVKQANLQGIVIKSQLAYLLSTPYHEAFNYQTGERFGAMKEMGGESYLKSKKYYPFYGRGPSHLTWDYNYQKEAKRTGLDLVKNPDLMMDVAIGSESHVHCMISGIYTGKKLSDYITIDKVDFIQARRIINGIDKADLIAEYAEEFLKCIV